MSKRYAVVDRGEYSDRWTLVIRIPKSLARDVLDVWIHGTCPKRPSEWDGGECNCEAHRGCGDADDAEVEEAYEGMFHRDFQETALAMIAAGIAKEDTESASP